VTTESYINSVGVCSFLEKMAWLGLQGPIMLVMDHARYPRCRLVMEKARDLDMELLFLPPYSPHLNLIERLWKFVKKECLSATYSEHFALFKQAITACLSETTGRHQSALNTLLTLEFQTLQPASCDL
jgi:transposase